MYLKSIEVQGFKSFANKMKFQFHNGITGIVGPNGSGKSNVGDAVRWVLGEQSVKQLRGSNMQDVIFSGTENRKPMGFAMVAITLDNSDHQLPVDYNEVTVTRRLYRSGESEYLINGAACRLKDIKEMFYDTGIGKEGYSIIGQGQIDKILNGKPEERRELFDEAAGIVKFKRRKMTAQKKLEEENGNLTRVSDILSELGRQIGPLERQSEKAKIYLKKREDLKRYDINMFLADMERIQGQLEGVEEKISISDSDLESARRQFEDTKAEYESTQLELEQLNGLIDEKRQAVNQEQMEKQQLESRVQLIQEQIRSAKMNDEHFESRLKVIASDLAQKQTEEKRRRKNLDLLGDELEQATGKVAENESCLAQLGENVSSLEEIISVGRAQLIDLLDQGSNTKAKLQRYITMTEQIQIRGAQLAQRMLVFKSEEEELLGTKEKLQTEYDEVIDRIKKLTEENAEIEKKINQAQEKLVAATRELEDDRTSYHRESSRLESLKNITERYDGYGSSIRRVMEQKIREPGLRGVVADLIRTEKKYETAIETALGGSIQNIVTDNEETAKRMIEFLKRNRYGRATFLPLTAIKKKGGLGNDNALYEPGALGVASTLVETDEAYEELVEYLLGKTLVVENIDQAVAIAGKYRHALRIVTLDGELMNPGGSMSGGAFKNTSNLLGRRREIEDLEKNVLSRKDTMEKRQKQLEELRQVRAELRNRLAAKTGKLQEEYLLQNTTKLKIDEINSRNLKNDDSYRQLQRESSEIEEQMRQLEEEKAAIQGELDRLEEEEKSLEASISSWQEKLEEKRRLLEEQNGVSSGVKAEEAALRQREEFLRRDIKRLETEQLQLKTEQEEIAGSMSLSRGDAREKEEEIREIRASIQEFAQRESAAQRTIEELLQKRQKKNDIHKDFFRKREEQSARLGDLDKERFRLDSQKERLEDYKERQINYMWEEYEMTPSEAEKYKDDSGMEVPQLKKIIAQLKNEIRGLGPVNVNAIEEYKELAERHTFLSEQHADLVKAGEALQKIIADLDAGMRAQFKEKFAIMQKEFEKSFKELFGGGKGTLELVEDEDILEAGIRIIAQPPGKKLQNMMQMSGGEKALTAIALLFAIQNMKPSPFCLLDEIEAALDENNVSRYANYLHKLTKNTQFIIITHRRGTMAVADRLYGITMQEKGVSTQVSVNMVESELDK